MRVLTLALLLCATPGCQKDTPPSPRPLAEPTVPAPAVAAEPAKMPEPAPPPAPTQDVDLEAEAQALVAGALAAKPTRLAFGPPGEHLLALSWSDDGTDVTGVAALAGGQRLTLGSIQRDREDQVKEVLDVAPCAHDPDPALELCVRYRADPLGSLREEPYTARTVFDWDEAAQRFTASSAEEPGASEAPAPPR